MKWRSFYENDLKLIVDTAPEVRKLADEENLNKSQIASLNGLHQVSGDRFEELAQETLTSKASANEDQPGRVKRRLKDLSAAEIDAITEKEKTKRQQDEQGKTRQTVLLASKVHVLAMSRRGIPIEIIASSLDINRKSIRTHPL